MSIQDIETVALRSVRIASWAAISSDEPGAIPGFDVRKSLPDRKHAKLMSRAVQLGVAAIRGALDAYPAWEAVPPERRGLFVGTSPGGGEPEDLLPALDAAIGREGFDPVRFGRLGLPLVPPLWLVRGLTNNVVGFASAYHQIRGPNTTRCDGRTAGLAAILDAARAVAEGRTDLAIAGGADSAIHAAEWLPVPAGEGAAFFVLVPGGEGAVFSGGGLSYEEESARFPAIERGAAGAAVELARRLAAGEREFRVEEGDPAGGRAWIGVG